MFKVRLTCLVFGPDCSCEFERFTDIPFAPTPKISLGVYDDSDFFEDEFRIERVMFHIPSGMFFVEEKDDGIRWEDLQKAEDCVGRYVESGWRVRLRFGHPSAVAAAKSMNVIGEKSPTHFVRGQWHANLSPLEIAGLRATGEDMVEEWPNGRD